MTNPEATPIDFRKRYSKYQIVKGINELANKWNSTPTEVCARILSDGISIELKKLKEEKRNNNV